ncbi:MAG: hypothetical protein WBM87_13120 [Woeseiaceae bacterium]
MRTIVILRMTAVFLLAAIIVAGCSAKPVLIAKSAGIPTGVDLSGHWTLRAGPGSDIKAARNREPQLRIPSDNTVERPTRSRSTRRASGPSVQLFLESGTVLKITQTDGGLFISFDRSIVEEYTFGENRVIAIGPIEAQRVSGWEGRAFVVETLDDEGSIMTETWRLDDGGNTLVRDITVVRGGKQKSFFRQRFDRAEPA